MLISFREGRFLAILLDMWSFSTKICTHSSRRAPPARLRSSSSPCSGQAEARARTPAHPHSTRAPCVLCLAAPLYSPGLATHRPGRAEPARARAPPWSRLPTLAMLLDSLCRTHERPDLQARPCLSVICSAWFRPNVCIFSESTRITNSSKSPSMHTRTLTYFGTPPALGSCSRRRLLLLSPVSLTVSHGSKGRPVWSLFN